MISRAKGTWVQYQYRMQKEEKKARTIDEFVNQNEVVLDGLLIHFPKVRLGNRYKSITEFENHGRIGIIPVQ